MSKLNLHKIQRLLNTKIMLTLLAFMLILHLTLLFFYVKESRQDKQFNQRQIMIQKIYNTVSTITNSPDDHKEQSVAAIDDPALSVSLSTSPLEDATVNKVSYWEIHQLLKNQNPARFSLSIQYQPHQWINIKATIIKQAISQQLALFIIEIFIFSACFISAWSIYRFTQPLRRFKTVAETLGVDLHTKPLDIYGPKVVQETAQALNLMQTRIQDLIRDRTQMLAAISHDLRTPITRLKLRSQFLEDQNLKAQFNNDLDEMTIMISETLHFASNDSIKEPLQRIDFTSFIHTLYHEQQDLGHNITLACPQSRIIVNARPITLKRALNNIINNAIKFSTQVTINIITKPKTVSIEIKDNGPGINEKELETVFEPFYRSEPSRSRDTGGVGLGLAVARDIIKTHHGTITLSNLKPTGLMATIKLPIQNKDHTPS